MRSGVRSSRVCVNYEELIHVCKGHETMPSSPPLQTHALRQLLRAGCGHDERQGAMEGKEHVGIDHHPRVNVRLEEGFQRRVAPRVNDVDLAHADSAVVFHVLDDVQRLVFDGQTHGEISRI